MNNNITHGELQTYLEEQVVLPSIQQEVEKLIKSKKIWYYLSIISETISQICSAIATILSFSAGFYQLSILSFLSGIINIISLLLLLFTKYCNEQNNRCITQLQKIPIFNIIRQNNNSNNIIY